jgi:NADH:ubiquinone oxidoreductase subunit 3 (subunit A)
MKKILTIIACLVAVVGLAAPALLSPATASAAAKTEIQKGYESAGGNKTTDDLATNIKDIINVMLYIVGAVSVIMIIYGGIRFATSGGNEKGAEAGRKTLIYAVVGLVVSILAYAIVNFVITNID